MPAEITLVEKQVLVLQGHAEITVVFREFEALHPAAKWYDAKLDPAPWNECHAMPFRHVPDDQLEELRARWEKQINNFLLEHGPVLVRALKERELAAEELSELANIKKYCPHHDSPENFRTNGENCEICGDFLDGKPEPEIHLYD
jgi:hypothetical protein